MDSSKLPFSLFDFFALIFPGAVSLFGIYWYFDPTLEWLRHTEINLSITFGLIVASYILGHVLHAASEILIDRVSNLRYGSVVGQYLETVGLATRVKTKNPSWFTTKLITIDWDPDVLFEWTEPSGGHEPFSNEKPFHWKRQADSNMGDLIHLCLHREFQVVPKRINHIFQLVLTYSQKSTKGESNEVPVFAAVETMFRSLIVGTLALFVVFLRNFYATLPVIELLFICFVILLFIPIFSYSYQRYKRMWVETIFSQFIVASSDKHAVVEKVASHKSKNKKQN